MSLFAVDPRSLALFRIALGLLLAFEALSLLPEASALLSDRGVLPRCSLQPSLPTDSEFCIKFCSCTFPAAGGCRFPATAWPTLPGRGGGRADGGR